MTAKNKRGFLTFKRKGEMEIVQKAIIFIAVLVVMISTYALVNKVMESQAEKAECIQSVAAHNMLNSLTKENIASYINCPTHEVLIKKDTSMLDAEHVLAESMKQCWDAWGNGEYTLFKDNGVYCHICSHITFEDKTKEIPQFEKYLSNTPVKDMKGYTYYTYLFGGREKSKGEDIKNIDETKRLLEQKNTNINTSYDYATIFVYVKGRDAINEFLASDGRGIGAIVGGGAIGLLGVGIITLGAGESASIVALPLGIVTIVGGILVIAGGVLWETVIHSADVKFTDESHLESILFVPLTAENLKNIHCQYSYAAS